MRPLSQLFSQDAERLHTPSLVELVLAQPWVGTTIKTGNAGEGEEEEDEGDPYAVLSVVNANVHLQLGNGACGRWLSMFLGRRLRLRRGVVGLCEELKRVLKNGQGQENKRHVGLVICERLVNMPVQVDV